jgi:hypothetical protein
VLRLHALHKQGRDFPVFERGGVKFGVVICSDGGYIEPSRILTLKGARIIFSPHFNYIGKEGLIGHFMQVRADHVAGAVENGVYFLRGNNVVLGKDPAITKSDGVGYGDSYVVDPYGEIVVRSRRHREDFLFADVDPAVTDKAWTVGRSLWGLRELHKHLLDAAGLKGRCLTTGRSDRDRPIPPVCRGKAHPASVPLSLTPPGDSESGPGAVLSRRPPCWPPDV